MIARRILTAATAAALVWRVAERRAEALEEPTREYEPVDLDDIGPRASRQIHGLAASELADADRSQAHAIRRMELELIGDADFRSLAASLLDEFPEQT